MKFIVVAFSGLTLVVILAVLSRQGLVKRRNSGPVPQEETVPLPKEELPLATPQKLLKGYKISCCRIASQHTIEELCPVGKLKTENFENGHCSCVQFLTCKLVLVTALSQNHFRESLDLFGSVYNKLPHKKFIVYDLGLSDTQLQAIQSYCNVKEVRKFDFDNYPPHTKILNKYAWKPFIIDEISAEFELFLYCDTSCRMTDTFVPFLPNILKFPIISLARMPKRSSVFRYTHQGLLDYLNVTIPRGELIEMMPQTFQAGIILVWANNQFMKKILCYWVDCAQHVDCIAPEGATVSGCNSTGKPFSAYIGCHRFDQSALNVILIREFGESLRNIFSSREGGIPWERPVIIDHRLNYNFNNSRSQQCHIQYSTL